VTVVTAGDGGNAGSCEAKLTGPGGGVIQPFNGEYYVTSGQQLTMEALNASGTPSWVFGDGQFGSGSPTTHTYVNGTAEEVQVTLKLTAGSCSKSYKVFISPSAGPDFTVADAGTGIALEWVTDSYKASAGQSLKFTATGTVGDVSWDFGDGTFSAEASPVKAYAPAVDTTFVVRLTNGDKSKQANVKVAGSTGAALTGKFTFAYADGSTVARGAVEPNKAIRFIGVDQATTYTWDFGDGSSLGQGSPVEHTFTRGGSFEVKVTVARDGVPGTVTTAAPLTFIVKTPPDPLLWVAGGMAYVDGGNGERFQSDLSIFNPGSQTATVSLAFVAGASWSGASSATWITEAIPAGQTKAYANVLGSLFRLDKGVWGVVLVKGDDVPTAPVIVSRTYNAANATEDGTFGLSVPAMSVAAGVKPQSSAGSNYLAGLRHDAAFRTNLTVANLKDETAEVEFVFRGEDGAVLGSPARIIVEPRGVKQLNAALSAAAPSGEGKAGGAGWATPAPHFSAEMQLKKGSGVYPYATVIDQGTGDSIVVTPAPRPSPTYRLPGILHYGQWVSDVSLLNPSAKERKVRVEYSFIKKGEADRTTKSKSVTLKAFEMKVWDDFFKSVLELAPEDTSEYSQSFVDIAPAFDDIAPTEPLVVGGKTYTASGKGTIGLQVDPYVFEDGIGAQASGKRILLSGLEANQAFRTNVALFLTPGAAASDSVEVDVHVFDARGRESKNIWVLLNADQPVKQLDSDVLFAGLTTTETERASIVISNPRRTARVGAYATVIDRKSLDATFVAGQPAP
jgi:PKD repeat protein